MRGGAPIGSLRLVLGVAAERAVQVRVAAGEDDRAREDVADGDLVRVGVRLELELGLGPGFGFGSGLRR